MIRWGVCVCVCERDVVDFLYLEVDASPLLELSVGSEEAVGPTDSVISSNRADSCLSKGGQDVHPWNIRQGQGARGYFLWEEYVSIP